VVGKAGGSAEAKPGRGRAGARVGGRRPIVALFDLLGRRWAMRVVWELRNGPMTFRDLQAACGGISSSVLSQRLAELREAGIAAEGNVLTDEGHDLLEAYRPLGAWAERWAAGRAGAAASRS
jgi:DNA-binding HxlR family transcriptional regulator